MSADRAMHSVIEKLQAEANRERADLQRRHRAIEREMARLDAASPDDTIPPESAGAPQ